MKRIANSILPLVLTLFIPLFAGGCISQDDGTITVKLTDPGSVNTSRNVYVYAFTEGATYDITKALASATFTVGTAEGILKSGSENKSFTGGEYYDIYMHIDANGAGGATPNTGDYRGKKTESVDGDTTVKFTITELVPEP